MRELTFETQRRTQLLDMTAQVSQAVAGADGTAVTLFVPHTTAGIVLQAAGEGAGLVAADVEAAFERIVAEDVAWRHTVEGDRNPWSHVRAALTASSVTIPLRDGELVLGERQSVFLAEFDGPRTRKLYVTVL